MDKKIVFRKVLSVFTSIYMIAILCLVPIILKNKYEMIGTFKYELFKWISIGFLGVILLLALLYILLYRRKFTFTCSLTDKFVAGYFVCTIISFILAGNKEVAWEGSQGWYMGMMTQIIFVLSYFVVSRLWDKKMWVWYLACGAAFIVFMLGILHRFSIDPLSMYDGLSDSMKIQYLSLLGQSSWYSSYVCTVFPLGLYFFWNGRKMIERVLGGIFGTAAFATLVTNNSDSSYIALGLVLLVLFTLSFEKNESMERFLEVIILMLITIQSTGLLRRLFPGQAVRLEPLSEFVTGSSLTGIVLVLVCCIYGAFLWFQKKGGEIQNWKMIRNITLLVVILAVVGMILFIILNTKGYIGGSVSQGGYYNYLMFSDEWGNGRGRTWKYTADVIRELPFYRKLFGVGPDCFASYGYAIPEYAQRLQQMWGNDTLTNAHNEWMNAIVNYGFVGATAYIGIFVSAFIRFLRAGKKDMFVFAAAFCIVSYMGHNLFCYQQVLCTPFIFLIIGMGENIYRYRIRNI